MGYALELPSYKVLKSSTASFVFDCSADTMIILVFFAISNEVIEEEVENQRICITCVISSFWLGQNLMK